MKGKYPGLMPVEDLFQALFQDREFFAKHGIRYIRNTALYFTPCDENGNPVTVRNSQGDVIDGYVSAGAYHSAADHFEQCGLEPEPVTHKPTVRKPGLEKK